MLGTIVSQRDSKWANIKVGAGDGTIGQVGCTITSLGYLVGLTPDKVNERINAVGGYSVNLVLWGKMLEAIGVQCYRYTTYDNTKVKEAIASDGAVLGEVSAVAIGGTGKHWVVMTGDGKVQDPWTGKERPTSDFTFTGYTTVKFDKSKMGNYTSDDYYMGLDLNNKDSMRECVKIWARLQAGDLVEAKDYVPKATYDAIKSSLEQSGLTINGLNSTISSLEAKVSSEPDRTKVAIDQAKAEQKKVFDVSEAQYQTRITQLETELANPIPLAIRYIGEHWFGIKVEQKPGAEK